MTTRRDELAKEWRHKTVNMSPCCDYHADNAFKAGYDSRDKEVEELKRKLEKCREALRLISDGGVPTGTYLPTVDYIIKMCGVARTALEAVGDVTNNSEKSL